MLGANCLDATITDGGELTHSYSVESRGEVKMTKQEIIEMIRRAGFEAVERIWSTIAWRKLRPDEITMKKTLLISLSILILAASILAQDAA